MPFPHIGEYTLQLLVLGVLETGGRVYRLQHPAHQDRQFEVFGQSHKAGLDGPCGRFGPEHDSIWRRKQNVAVEQIDQEGNTQCSTEPGSKASIVNSDKPQRALTIYRE